MVEVGGIIERIKSTAASHTPPWPALGWGCRDRRIVVMIYFWLRR
jgi:hypothetical protein